MSTKKKGLLTVSGEWAKHLRPWGKRRFWSQERMAEKYEADSLQREMDTVSSVDKGKKESS